MLLISTYSDFENHGKENVMLFDATLIPLLGKFKYALYLEAIQ